MKPINRRQVIEHALEVAELVNKYIPTSIEKDDDSGEGLLVEMASVLEEVKGAMAAPDNTTQESLRRIAAKASGLLEEYTRRRGSWKPSKKDSANIPPEEVGEADDQEESDEEASEDDESPVEADLKKSVRRRLQGRLNERAWWQSLGYK
jgi:hypothetical protein